MLTVTAPEPEPSPLQKHLAATYFTSRLGLGVIGIAFPFILALGGRLWAGLPLQGSMSAYYHAAVDGRSMRVWFVGVLFALGALLYLYKGFSDRENVALNIGGIMLVLVAVFPMEWECGASCSTITVHGTSAIVFFVCIAFVAAFCADETLELIRDPKRRKRYRGTYRTLAGLMLASPLAAFLLTTILQRRDSMTFFVEALGIFAFAAYWLTKGREMRETHADVMGLEGTLVETPPEARPSAAGKRAAGRSAATA